jgi:hypothetical protein
MKTAFVIYCRAVGLYALLTLPAIMVPIMYIISLVYVLIFGWFAWFAFTLLYLAINNLISGYLFKLLALFPAVAVSVAFAFQMLEILDVEKDVWNSGFLIFPFAAVITGWVSVCVSKERIRNSCRQYQ